MRHEVVGLVPMAGWATRLAPLPCSKELYPAVAPAPENGPAQPKVVSQFLLERMRLAGIRKAFLVIREGKWDIPAYFNDGTELLDMHLAYAIAGIPYGPPFSIDAAYPFVQECIVAMGFPDIVFWPEYGFERLLIRQKATRADVVLGLFRLAASSSDDRVEVDGRGRVLCCQVNATFQAADYSWIIAVWTPVFSRFMHEFLLEQLGRGVPGRELSIGHVIHAAVKAGLLVQSVAFPDGRFLDIGTPDRARLLPSALEHSGRIEPA